MYEVELDLVDPANPLLAFAEDGRFVPPQRELPPEALWVAFPADREPTTGGADGATPRVIAESRLPLGWAGWRLVQIALDDAAWLGLGGDTPRRGVRGRDRPQVITGDPVPGVTTLDGSPVFAGLPAVRLPGGTEAAWSITVRRSRGGPPIRTGSWTAPEPTEIADLWPGTAGRPLLGRFVITVRGPIGRGVRRTVTVAEGLGVRYEPAVRLFHEGGLVSSRAGLTARPGLEIDPPVPVFTGRTREQTVTCTAGRESLPLAVTPPHMRVLAERPGRQATDGPGTDRQRPDRRGTDRQDTDRRGTEWSAGPLWLDLGELEEIDALRIEIPGVTVAFPLGVVVDGAVVQEVDRSAWGRHSLRRVLDTVIAHGGASLVVPAGRASPEAIPVAEIAAVAEPAGPAGDPWLDVEWGPRRTPSS